MCLYQLTKNFEYKKAEERKPLTEAMNLLLPQVNFKEVIKRKTGKLNLWFSYISILSFIREKGELIADKT